MLVLTRRPGESIVIGNEVVVTVLEVRGDQIRVGIEAPRSVQIHRQEVHEQLASENVRAAQNLDRAREVLGRRPPERPRPQTETDTP